MHAILTYLSRFPPNVSICVSPWSTFQAPGPPSTLYCTMINKARFRILQNLICYVLFLISLSPVVHRYVLCEKHYRVFFSSLFFALSLQCINLSYSKALLLSTPLWCCWDLRRLHIPWFAAHSQLTCCTTEWSNLLPSENFICTYIGKRQALSHKNHWEDYFPKENKHILAVLSDDPATLARAGFRPDSETEINPTPSLQESKQLRGMEAGHSHQPEKTTS